MGEVLKIPGENILFPWLAGLGRLPVVLSFWSPPLSTKLATSNIKNLQTINTGEDVEKGNVGGNVNWDRHLRFIMENSKEVPQKT